MCCTWLTEKHRMQKIAICAPSHNFANKACIDNQKKLVTQQYLLHMSSQYGELWPTNGWDWLACLGHPDKFQRVSDLGFVTALTSLSGGQPNLARCLTISWAGTLYIHFWGLLPPNWILLGAKFTLLQSLAFSYIGSFTAWHSNTGRAAITLGIGPYSTLVFRKKHPLVFSFITSSQIN